MSVDLPDGVTFDQYVIVLPEADVVAAVDAADAVLMVRRHRFIVNRWVWELPGGYVDEGEDLDAAVTRELEEETGWRPGHVEHLADAGGEAAFDDNSGDDQPPDRRQATPEPTYRGFKGFRCLETSHWSG